MVTIERIMWSLVSIIIIIIKSNAMQCNEMTHFNRERTQLCRVIFDHIANLARANIIIMFYENNMLQYYWNDMQIRCNKFVSKDNTMNGRLIVRISGGIPQNTIRMHFSMENQQLQRNTCDSDWKYINNLWCVWWQSNSKKKVARQTHKRHQPQDILQSVWLFRICHFFSISLSHQHSVCPFRFCFECCDCTWKMSNQEYCYRQVNKKTMENNAQRASWVKCFYSAYWKMYVCVCVLWLLHVFFHIPTTKHIRDKEDEKKPQPKPNQQKSEHTSAHMFGNCVPDAVAVAVNQVNGQLNLLYA